MLKWPIKQSFFALKIFLLLFYANCLQAQGNRINFKHLSIEDGLSQNGAFSIEQDSKGFIWVGTKDGLNKFDGYSFTIYTHNPYDSTTISSNYIGALFEDGSEILWVISNDGDINLMDSKTEVSHKIPVNIQYITSIAEDREGNIWIGTYRSGLYLIKRKNILTSNFQITNYKHHPGEPTSISDNDVLSIAADNDGVLWIGTNSGLDKFSSHTQKRFEHYILNKKAPANKIDNAISSVLINNDSTLWLGSASGLIFFNKNNGRFKLYPNGFRYERVKYGEGLISDIVKDRVGNLWMRSAGYLVSFNVYDKTYNYVERDILPSISRVVVDNAGNIWIGTSYGIYIYSPESNWFKSFPNKQYKKQAESHLSIRALFEDSHDNLWFSSYNYIYKWHRKTNALTTYGNPLDVKEFGSTGASSIIEDRNGNLWFTTYEGLYRLNIKTNERTHFKTNPHPYQAGYGVFEGRSGSIWVVTEEYLSKLTDIPKSQFVNYRYNNKPTSGFSVGSSVIYQDGQGDLWFTTNMGLIKFNQGNEKFTIYSNDPGNSNSIYSNIIKCICPDPRAPEEKLWIGTSGGGLNLFDRQTETFTHIMEKDGLPNNVVYGILPDEENNLWLSTNKGLSNYNPVTKQFINYDVTDGLQNYEFNTGAFFKSKSGELFFGGISGFNYFYPQQIVKRDFTPNIVFTDFKLFNKSVSIRDDNSILKKIISETDEIILSHKDNFISFEFASLDYYGTAKNKYSFKLKGFNKEWIQLGTKREVTFTNLDPGEYTLIIKGTNSDGVWNENAASLKVIIFPPWWKTWLAYTIYGIFFFANLYFIRRYELKRFLLKSDLKLEKVETEKLRSLDQLKSRFFANISHEFRTPLTLILGPIQQLLEKQTDETAKHSLTMMQRNAARLLKLINQLLDLTKLDAGKMQIRVAQTDFIPFIKGIVMSYESLAQMQGIQLGFHSENESLALFFECDKLEKVFHNLLSNAFKFTPKAGRVSVTASHPTPFPQGDSDEGPSSAKTTQFIQIAITNTGSGISKERLPYIFDRFYQAENSAEPSYEGTGIGLALVKELVELHHGQVRVESEIGVGSVFTVMLPLGKEHFRVEEVIENETALSNSMEASSRSLKQKFGEENPPSNDDSDASPEDDAGEIPETDVAKPTTIYRELVLIIEDNSDVRTYIRQQLHSTYQVVEAVDGKAGVEKAFETIPDLVISDLMMPKMSGYEVCRTLKTEEKTSHIPIILLTARAEQEDRLEGLQTGADDYLTKPFDARELLLRVKNLIAVRRKLRERYRTATVIQPREVSANSLDQQFLGKIIKSLETHLSEEEFGVETLCKEVAMSERQLRRKMKALIDQSPNQFIRSFRLQRAKQLLEQGAGTVSDIAYDVGFGSTAYFAKCFREQFGVRPSEVGSSY